MVRKILSIAAVGGLMLVAACNTVKGAGEDIQSVGECGENTMDGRDC